MDIQDTFRRYELKYLLNENQYAAFRAQTSGLLAVDRYGETTISSIYYDTPDSQLIRSSLEKPVYKEKLRLRAYGDASDDSTVFVEVKKKYLGIVYKRRVGMKLFEAEDYLDRLAPAPKPGQVTAEIDDLLSFYAALEPAMLIAYDRTALAGTEKPDLRVTFDRNIRWRDTELDLRAGSDGELLLKPGQRLMEIKITDAMPLPLARTLSELGIYPTSLSKYGEAYLNSQKENRVGVTACA